MSKVSLYANIALVITVAILFSWLQNVRQEKNRLANNQEALLSDVDYYKTEAGNSAASVQMLELSKSELEKHCTDLTKTVHDLNIKVKRIQAAATTATESKYEIKTVVKDSIVYRDRPITLQNINYSDPWIDLRGTIDSSVFYGKISTRDTIVQVIHRIPKKFLFFRWGTKAIRQEVVSKNPNSTIVFTEYIELKK